MIRRSVLFALAGLLLLAPRTSEADTVAEGFQLTAADTVRTNLWLTEALMAEASEPVIAAMPPAPAVVSLVPADREKGTGLLTTVLTSRLQRAGYEVHVEAVKGTSDSPAYELRYEVLDLAVAYPETGRRLGIWRQWVGRSLVFGGSFMLVETPGGRVVYNEHVRRSYRDRVSSDDLAGVQDAAFPFTMAQAQDSGWHRRLEQVVVLGALAGLVAVYFQNTN